MCEWSEMLRPSFRCQKSTRPCDERCVCLISELQIFKLSPRKVLHPAASEAARESLLSIVTTKQTHQYKLTTLKDIVSRPTFGTLGLAHINNVHPSQCRRIKLQVSKSTSTTDGASFQEHPCFHSPVVRTPHCHF